MTHLGLYNLNKKAAPGVKPRIPASKATVPSPRPHCFSVFLALWRRTHHTNPRTSGRRLQHIQDFLSQTLWVNEAFPWHIPIPSATTPHTNPPMKRSQNGASSFSLADQDPGDCRSPSFGPLSSGVSCFSSPHPTCTTLAPASPDLCPHVILSFPAISKWPLILFYFCKSQPCIPTCPSN